MLWRKTEGEQNGVAIGVIRRVANEKVQLSKDWNEGTVRAMQITWEESFQAEGRASAKALGPVVL